MSEDEASSAERGAGDAGPVLPPGTGIGAAACEPDLAAEHRALSIRIATIGRALELARGAQSGSEARFRALVQAVHDYAIFMVDPRGVITESTDGAQQVFGYTAAQITGRHLSVLFTAEDVAAGEPQRELAQAERDGRAERDAWRVHRSGRRIWTNSISTPIRGPAGEVLGYTKISRDLTERKLAEEEREALKSTLAAQLDDLRRLHDLSMRLIESTDLPRMLEEILDATIALQRADFGYVQLLEPASRSLRMVAERGLPPDADDRQGRIQLPSDTVCGRAWRDRARVIVADIDEDPQLAPYRELAARIGYRGVQCTPIFGRDGQIKGMIGTLFRAPHRPGDRDLQLTDLYMRLAAELIERAQHEEALRSARDAADRANQSKSRFLATASHDLRQPLQTLSLLNGALNRLVRDPRLVQVVAEQDRALGAMFGLLDALLDISKLESGAVKPQIGDFDLDELLDELRVEFAGVVARKSLRLEIEASGARVRSDRTLLGQVLRNLVSNAVRYTREGTVALRCAREREGLRIEVADTGIGIAPEHLPHIFDEFYQIGVAPNSMREGHGLGLSIVRRVARLLGHELQVSSQPGRGSVFAVVLPLGAAAVRSLEPPPAPETGGPGGRQRRVLLVDDNPSVLTAMGLLLEVEGYRVSLAQSGADALAIAAGSRDIELLVTDFHLAGGELGTDLIRAVRALLGPQLKAVLVTGDTSSAVKRTVQDDRIRIASKPVRAEDLLSIFASLLEPPRA